MVIGMATIVIHLKMISDASLVGGGMFFLLFLSACTIVPGLDANLDLRKDGAPTEIGGFDLVQVDPTVVSDLLGREAPVVWDGFLNSADSLERAGMKRSSEYIVGAGDVLNIIVWDHPELTSPTGEFRDPASSGRLVSAEGLIFYPYVGELRVAGWAVGEIRRLISKRLARVVRDPQVDVRVAAFRSQRVKISGAVAQPAVVNITDSGLTVIEAIANAGGMTEASSRRAVVLSREGVDYRINLSRASAGEYGGDVRLIHGDELHVLYSKDQAAYVLGAVNNQASLPMPRGTMSVNDALASVGGVNSSSADVTKIFIVRGEDVAPNDGDTRAIVYTLDMSSVSAFLMSERFMLWPRDVVYIDRTGLATYNAVIGQILPTVSTLFQLDRLIDDD